MKTYLSLFLLAGLIAPASAQCLEDPANDLQLLVTPTLAAAGQPVMVSLTNTSSSCTYQLPTTGCVFLSVKSEKCDGDTKFAPACLAALFAVPPGVTVVGVWDQLDDSGVQVADGLYAFEVDVITPSGASLELCPSVQIGTGCVSPFNYGQGTPGSGGNIPNLSGIGGFPHVGSTSFGVAVTNGLGGANSTVVASLSEASLGLGFGTILIDLSQTVLTVLLPLSPGGPGQGIGLLTTPVPSLPGLIGLEVFFQAVVDDPAAAAGLALTQGVRIAICP